MWKLGNVAEAPKCAACGAVTSPRWRECLACGASLDVPTETSVPRATEGHDTAQPTPMPTEPTPGTSVAEPDAWDGEMCRLIEWFMTTRPPREPVALTTGVVIARPAPWWTVMRRELALGPHGTPRARTGALREDLLKLAALMRDR